MTRGRAVLALWAATVVGAIAMIVVISALLAEIGEGPALALMFSVLAADAVAFATVGLLIARRRPGNRVAWVLALAGVLLVTTFSGFGVGAFRYQLYGPDDLLGGLCAAFGGAAIGPALFTAVPLLAIMFPDGRLPGPRWRVPFTIAVGLIVVPSVVGALQPGPVNTDLPDNPLGIDSPLVVALGAVGTPLLPVGILVGALLAIAAVATRFRRSSGTERQQVKWLLAAVVVIGVVMPPSFVDDNGESGFTLLDALAFGSLSLLPLAVGLAVTRYRLYEIDRIISRTLGWLLVTGALLAVFAGLMVALQAALTGFTQGETLAVAVSTLVAAALFQPVRRRVQHGVDRRFDRARYDGERIAAGYAGRLRAEVSLARLERDTVTTVGTALRPTSAALWIRGADR